MCLLETVVVDSFCLAPCDTQTFHDLQILLGEPGIYPGNAYIGNIGTGAPQAMWITWIYSIHI